MMSEQNETNRPIVTIIVPVYNVKDYLEKAFDSICSQTLTNWELYLVDDGSTDGSSTICDILASDDSRVHVIHQENQGAAAARNAALSQAKGKYLYFMDADDWAVPEMLYEMVCLAENYLLDAWAGTPVDNAGRRLSSIGRTLRNPSDLQADVPEEQCAQLVITGFYIETYYSDEDYYLQKQAVRPRVFADPFSFREYAHVLFDHNLLYTPWNKLYLTSYIRENEITFPQMHWDDFPFNMDVIRNISRVTVTDKAYYHFIRKRSDSESEKYNPGLFERREEENTWLQELYQNWKGEYQNFLIEEMKRDPSLIPMFQEPEEKIEVSPSKKPVKEGKDGIFQDAVKGKENAADEAARKEEPEAAQEEKPEEAVQSDAGTAKEEMPGTETAKEEKTETDAQTAETSDEKELPAIPVPQVQIPSAQASEFIARRYLERVVGCIENVTNEACTLSKKEKRQEIKKIIRKDSVREALKTARPRSSYMKLMLVPVRMKSVSLTYLEGSVISSIKKKHVKLFAKLKANR